MSSNSENDVQLSARPIRSHKIYKVETSNDGTLEMEARISSQRTKDDRKYLLRKECVIRLPIKVGILQSVALLFTWIINKTNVASTILRTENANEDVFVLVSF